MKFVVAENIKAEYEKSQLADPTGIVYVGSLVRVIVGSTFTSKLRAHGNLALLSKSLMVNDG